MTDIKIGGMPITQWKQFVLDERLKSRVAELEAEVARLREVLHRIALPDYVLKNEAGHMYSVLSQRMAWARAALAAGEKETGE